MSNSRKSGIFVFIVCAFSIGLLRPFAGLAPQGHYIISVTLVSLALWIFKTDSIPYIAGGVLFLAGCLIFKLPLAAITIGYTSSAIWVLIPALFFGFALLKTGLGKRIACFVLKTFEPNYLTICVSWFIIGLILSALTPSITVRFAIVMPIAMSFIEACKIPERSRGSALICLTAWAAALLPGIGWQTGSLWGIIMPGFYPPQMKALATADVWFRYMAVPWFTITLIFLILLYMVFKPKEPLQLKREVLEEQYKALGRITRQEIVCGVILICALILFSTERWTGVKSVETALMALAALIIFGIIKSSDISTGVNWDIINFIAIIMSLTSVFGMAGISNWARPLIEPGILSLAVYPLAFLLVVTIVFWAIRFVDVPWGYTAIALFSPIFVPLYEKLGLHPVLVGVALIAAGNSFFLAYQQPFIMIGDTMTRSKGWSGGHVALGGALYAIAVLAGICISSFYWRAMGLMPG
jgi:di/tricarboxylate transporter